MSRAATKTSGDRTPVTGGINPSARVLRSVDIPRQTVPRDALGKHILRLLTLHKDLSLKFRRIDLSTMDAAAKQALLDDINSALGIKPIKPPTA